MFLGVVSSSYINIVRAQREANEIRKMYSQVRDFVDLFSQEVRLSSIDYGCYLTEGEVIPSCTGAANTVSTISEAFQMTCPKGPFTITGGRSSDLVLVRKDGLTKTVFHFNRDLHKIQMVQYENNAGGGWKESPQFPNGDYKNIFDDTIQVDDVKFAINPDVNPYSEDYYCINQKQFQPKVTLFMRLKNGANVQSAFSFDYQTTVSSRVYSR
jgi:hypothetical protein